MSTHSLSIFKLIISRSQASLFATTIGSFLKFHDLRFRSNLKYIMIGLCCYHSVLPAVPLLICVFLCTRSGVRLHIMCLRIQLSTCVHACARGCVRAWAYVRMHTRAICLCEAQPLFVLLFFVYVCAYGYTYTYAYTYTYTYIYVQSKKPSLRFLYEIRAIINNSAACFAFAFYKK